MTVAEVLMRLDSAGIALSMMNGKIAAGPRDRLTDELRAVIRSNMAQLIESLSARSTYWRLRCDDGVRLVTVCPPATAGEIQSLYPSAARAEPVVCVEPPKSISANCSNCSHASAFGNCGDPIRAGLTANFEIAKHPNSGEGCEIFDPRRSAQQEALLVQLLELTGRFYDTADSERLRSAILAGDDSVGVALLLASAEAALSTPAGQQ